MHLASNKSGYVSAALVLRSKEIADPRGLAHIMEHTSFTGAAGSLSAKEVKTLHSDCIQDSNATTGRGDEEGISLHQCQFALANHALVSALYGQWTVTKSLWASSSSSSTSSTPFALTNSMSGYGS